MWKAKTLDCAVRTIRDFEFSRRVITARTFGAYPIADSYRELSERLGHDFAPVIRLLERMPTFISGELHKQTRMRMARRNEAIKPVQIAAAADYLARFEAESLRGGREIELVSGFALPLFRAMARAAGDFAGLSDPLVELIEEVPKLFSSFTPLRQRLEINGRVADALAGCDDATIDDMALMVLGVYPLTGSLALSLHAVVSENPHTPLNAIDWPESFSATALHYVDRICSEPISLHGESFEAGERVRCMLSEQDWSAGQRRSLAFGAGSHLCLGRALADLVWSMSAATFARQRMVAEARPLEMDPRAEPFHIPASAVIVLHP